MVLQTKIEATIVAWVDKWSIQTATQEFARDTKKALDPVLKKDLELNLANFQQKLEQARNLLKQAKINWNKDAEFEARMRVNALQRDTTEAKRILNNYVNTGNTSLSRLQTKFNQVWQGIVNSLKNLVWPLAIVWLITSAVRWLFNEFKRASDAAAKFETAMSNVATLVDTSVESIDEMWKQLLDISTRVPKSVEELTSALYDVRSAGITAENAMSVLEQSARLATAGLGTTKEAVNLMTSAFNTFASQWYTAEVIASSFFLAVKNGKTTISELSQGFGSVSALVQSLNVDFRDFLAATTALTTSWLSASEAYTQVGGILTAVAKQTPQSIAVAKKLWFEFSATALEAKWLSWFIADLWDKLAENWIEWAKTTEVLSKLFGRKEALVWVLSLLNSRSEQYADILREMTGESNAFLEAFDKQSRTADARVQKLTNELEKERIKLWQTTSAWRWFGTYLKIQFIKTLNSVWNTFGALADIAVWSFKIIFQTAKGALWGIAKLVTNFFKTGKVDFSAAFNFEWARAEVDKLFNKVKNRFNWSADETAEAVKERNEVISKLNEELWDDFDKLWDKSSWALDKEAVKEYEDAVKDMTSLAWKAYDELTKSIEWSVEAQKKLKDELADIEIGIADRVVEIDKEKVDLDKEKLELQNKLNQTTDNDARLKINKELLDITKEQVALDAERAKAFEWLSAEEEIKFQEILDEQKRVSELTEIEKLLELKAQKELALQEELASYEDLVAQKTALEVEFSKFLAEKVAEEWAMADRLKQQRLAVAAARTKAMWWWSDIPGRAIWWPVSAWSPYIVGERWPELFTPTQSGNITPNNVLNNNININANVSNEIELDQLANELASKIALSRKGIF